MPDQARTVMIFVICIGTALLLLVLIMSGQRRQKRNATQAPADKPLTPRHLPPDPELQRREREMAEEAARFAVSAARADAVIAAAKARIEELRKGRDNSAAGIAARRSRVSDHVHIPSQSVLDVIRGGDFVVVDTETTGLDAGAQVMEIAIVEPDGTLSFCRRCLPTVEIEPGAARVTGITIEDLYGEPTWAELWPNVLARVEGKTAIAFNAAYDSRVIAASCRAFDLEAPPITWGCAMHAYAHSCGMFRISLKAALKRERLAMAGSAHSAAGDAEATWRLMMRLAGKL